MYHGKYFLGVDCGQTHLSAVIIDQEEEIAKGKGGPTHIQGADMAETFRNSIEEALENIDQNLLKQIQAIGLGVSGIGISGKRDSIISVLTKRFPGIPYFLENDAVTAHWGATHGKDGASILAGTGTIAFGRYLSETQRLGGFGYLLGDEGGGDWIGLNAMRRVLRSVEGRDFPTSLVGVIKDYFSIQNVRQLPSVIYSRNEVDVQKIAGLANGVAQEALNGDQVACEIFFEAGNQLGQLAIYLLEHLHVTKQESFPIYQIGGIWRSGSVIKEPFSSSIKIKYPNAVIQEPAGDPAYGAAIFARACFDEQNRLKDV